MSQDSQIDNNPTDHELLARVKVAASTWQHWTPRPLTEPRFAEKLCGITNASVQVTDGHLNWVIRFNQSIADPGINRTSEYTAMMLGAAKGLCPAPAYIDDAFLVTPHQAGDPPAFGQLELIGKTFAKVHQLTIDPRLDELALSTYLPACYQAAGKPNALQEQVQNILASLPIEPKVLCHNDMLFENLLYCDVDQSIQVLDWEYAKVSPPSFDLATFTHHYHLNDQQLARLLDGYRTGETIASVTDFVTAESIRSFEPVAALISQLWFGIKHGTIESRLS